MNSQKSNPTTFFEEILHEYEINRDPATFKQLNSRPTENQQYILSLPSIFTYIQANIINDPKDFSELKADILRDCTFRLIDSFNVSLSHEYDEYNPLIFYFPYVLQIGYFLIQWLLYSVHRHSLMDDLFITEEEEFHRLQERVYQLIMHVFNAYKYLSDFQAFGKQRSLQLFQALFLWLSLTVFDPKERLLGFVSDRLIDIAVEWEDIVYENFARILQTFDYLSQCIEPIPYGKVYACLCDLFALVYEMNGIKGPVLDRIEFILKISKVNFEGSKGLLTKVAQNDMISIERSSRGKTFLNQYEYSSKGGWRLREGSTKVPVSKTASPRSPDSVFPAPPLIDPATIPSTPPPPGPLIKKSQSQNSLQSPKLIPRSPAHQELMKFGSHLLKVGSFFPTIRRRWFQLSDDQFIRYYVDESMSVCKGEFEARNIKQVSPLSLDNWFEWKTDSHVHGGIFRLRCDSPELYYTWTNYLRRCGVVIRPSK